MSDIKCPACGARNVEKIDITKYKCPYCDHIFKVEIDVIDTAISTAKATAKKTKYFAILLGIISKYWLIAIICAFLPPIGLILCIIKKDTAYLYCALAGICTYGKIYLKYQKQERTKTEMRVEAAKETKSEMQVQVDDEDPIWTTDFGLFDAHGPVKEITGYVDPNILDLLDGNYAQFDTIGRCVNLSENSTRSMYGFLIPNRHDCKFVYNNQGMIDSIITIKELNKDIIKYEYNKDNFLTTCKLIQSSYVEKHQYGYIKWEEVEKTKMVFVYEPIKIDSCGNWIKRKCSVNGKDLFHDREIKYWTKNNSYISTFSDLTFFDVKGPVKTIEEMYVNKLKPDGSVYAFDENGRCTNLPSEYIRNDNRIIGYSYTEYFGEVYEKYEYNDNGLIYTSTKQAIGNMTSTFEYDSDGRLIFETRITEGSEEGEDYYFDEKFTYKYIKFDEYGNWTERIRTCSSVGDTGGYNNVGDTENQIRIITYH